MKKTLLLLLPLISIGNVTKAEELSFSNQLSESHIRSYFGMNEYDPKDWIVMEGKILRGDLIIPLTDLKAFAMMNSVNSKNLSIQEYEEDTSNVCPKTRNTCGYRMAYLPPAKSYVNNVRIGYRFGELPNEWIAATKSAINELNQMEAAFSFVWMGDLVGNTQVHVSYDPHIFDYYPTKVAVAELGTVAGVGEKIFINPDLDDHSTSKRKNIMIHELLHIVGFQHRGTTEGRMIPNTDRIYKWCKESIMDEHSPGVCFFDESRLKMMPYL